MSIISKLNQLEQEVIKLQANQKEPDGMKMSFSSSGSPFVPADPLYLISQIRSDVVNQYEQIISLQDKVINNEY